MSADELEESLDFDEADALMIRRSGRRRRRDPTAKWTKAQWDAFNRTKAARAKEIAVQVAPVNGKCPEGYHLDWAKHPVLLPGMVGMPAPRKVCQPDKPGTMPTGYIPPPIFRAGQCGTRSEGRGITWGAILPQYRHLSRAERQAVVDEMCGRKVKPPIEDDDAHKGLVEQYNAAKSKYELLVTEVKTIRDQYRRKNTEVAKARRVLADATRRLKIRPRPVTPLRWGIRRYRRR